VTAATPGQAAYEAFTAVRYASSLTTAWTSPVIAHKAWEAAAQAAIDAAAEGSLRACGYTLADIGRFLEAEAAAATPALPPLPAKWSVRDPQAEQDYTEFTGWWEAQGWHDGQTCDFSDLRNAFGAGMRAARDLAAAHHPQPAPGHMLVMRGTIALRDAEIEQLRTRMADLEAERDDYAKTLDHATTARHEAEDRARAQPQPAPGRDLLREAFELIANASPFEPRAAKAWDQRRKEWVTAWHAWREASPEPQPAPGLTESADVRDRMQALAAEFDDLGATERSIADRQDDEALRDGALVRARIFETCATRIQGALHAARQPQPATVDVDLLGVAVQALREIAEDATAAKSIAGSALGIIGNGFRGEMRWELVPVSQPEPQPAPGDAPPSEPLTHFFHCWRFPDHHACAVALIERQGEENTLLIGRNGRLERELRAAAPAAPQPAPELVRAMGTIAAYEDYARRMTVPDATARAALREHHGLEPAPELTHTREDVIASYNAGYIAAVEKHAQPASESAERKLSIALGALRQIDGTRHAVVDQAALWDIAREAIGQVRDVDGQLTQPAPEAAGEGEPPDIRPRKDGRAGLDITCGSCGEDYGTNVPDADEIECPECGAHRCPRCTAWYGGGRW
jgi:hypothetical protein